MNNLGIGQQNGLVLVKDFANLVDIRRHFENWGLILAGELDSRVPTMRWLLLIDPKRVGYVGDVTAGCGLAVRWWALLRFHGGVIGES